MNITNIKKLWIYCSRFEYPDQLNGSGARISRLFPALSLLISRTFQPLNSWPIPPPYLAVLLPSTPLHTLLFFHRLLLYIPCYSSTAYSLSIPCYSSTMFSFTYLAMLPPSTPFHTLLFFYHLPLSIYLPILFPSTPFHTKLFFYHLVLSIPCFSSII